MKVCSLTHEAAIRTSDIRDPDDLLAYVAGALKAQGRPVDSGMVVELEPLFHNVFLGGEIHQPHMGIS